MLDEKPDKVTAPLSPTTTSALTATIVGIGALMPNKVVGTIVGMSAPFLSRAIIWFGYEQTLQWLAERKTQAPTRRAERYLRQMERRYRKLQASDPEKALLQTRIAQLTDRLHEHKMNGLELGQPNGLPATIPTIPKQNDPAD